MQETKVLVETGRTTGEETTSCWFELPIDVAEDVYKRQLLKYLFSIYYTDTFVIGCFMYEKRNFIEMG